MSPTRHKCRICSLETEPTSNYCSGHAKAVKNLREGHVLWNKAYGKIAAKEYFDRLSKLGETGKSVLETIHYFEDHLSDWE